MIKSISKLAVGETLNNHELALKTYEHDFNICLENTKFYPIGFIQSFLSNVRRLHGDSFRIKTTFKKMTANTWEVIERNHVDV